MNENKKKNSALTILGLIALILVLFFGVKFVFAALDAAIPELKDMAADYEQRNGTSTSVSIDDAEDTNHPNFCPYCGQGLFEGFQWGQYCPDCGKQVTDGGT